jgi:hypothetical protein
MIFFLFGVIIRYSLKKYKVNYFCPKEKDWIRGLVMGVKGFRHHTHPINLVSTNLALNKIKINNRKTKIKLRKLLLKSLR